MKKQPKISIITPSFNQGRFIADAIESVANQDYQNKEHIIIDAQSTDETLDVLKSYSHYKHLKWISEPDKGQSDALNKGFKLANGDIIGWLNADDFYHKKCFTSVVDFFNKNTSVDILYGDYHWIDDKGKLIQKRKEIDFDSFVLKSVVSG
jgi:glycosyltransferase involved in cell wall biosynthesis